MKHGKKMNKIKKIAGKIRITIVTEETFREEFSKYTFRVHP